MGVFGAGSDFVCHHCTGITVLTLSRPLAMMSAMLGLPAKVDSLPGPTVAVSSQTSPPVMASSMLIP